MKPRSRFLMCRMCLNQRSLNVRSAPPPPLLPRMKERYQALIEGIGTLSAKHLPQAREQMRALVGDILLTPTKAGYLEATVTGRYAGLVNLLSGGKLNRDGCGGRI